MTKQKWLAPLALLAVSAQMAAAQGTLAIAPAFQTYHFAKGFGLESASLIIVPVAYEIGATRKVSFDLYSAYARGETRLGAVKNTLQGLVDTRVRANFHVAGSTVLTASLNLPTGNSAHDIVEANVANALSTELLGFREALWGTGFGATTGIATAQRWGTTGIGLGASYRLATAFEPTDSAVKYTPGNEMRVRVAFDKDLGANKLTAGVTFQNYSDDKLDGRNLFAPGNRWRTDLAYSFRTSATSSWTLFATDVWRENGDVTLRVVNNAGAAVGDTTFRSGQQNLIVVGIAGATAKLRPAADFRVITRKSGEDEGWLSNVGADLPFRRGGTDFIPSLKLSYGKMEGAGVDTRYSVVGGEASLTLRWGAPR